MAVCKYCQKDITWMKEGRKNVPVEGDGSVHRCDNMINAHNSLRSIGRTSLTPEEIKQYEESMNQQVNKTKKK
mgnify:CR=1 FL=1